MRLASDARARGSCCASTGRYLDGFVADPRVLARMFWDTRGFGACKPRRRYAVRERSRLQAEFPHPYIDERPGVLEPVNLADAGAMALASTSPVHDKWPTTQAG